MTEYGRGPGSEPWHPEDPLFGDVGWEGQQAQPGQQSSYGGQPQHYPEQPQQPQQYGDWGHGQQADYGQAQQQYQVYDEQGNPQYPDQQQWADQQQYADQSHQQYAGQEQQYQQGGWDGTGVPGQVPYVADPVDPYGQQAAAYGEQQPDFYGTPEAYPPPEPPSRRRTEPEPEKTDWDPGPDQGEHAFFAGGGDDDDEADDEPDGRGRGDRRGKGGKGKGKDKGGKERKRRNGCACLVVVMVFGGGLATVGYFGYQFYQNRFGTAPDYAGDGTGSVSVSIPKGAGGYTIGQELKKQGVVKSVDAFVAAQSQNPDGKKIQAGVFLLKKEMSAASAVKLMLDPKSQDNLIVPTGWRNSKIYAAIDKKLQVSDGTTKAIAKKDYKSFGLPSWANSNKDIKDPLEGFLYPGTYGAAKGMNPETVLKQMVAQASDKYGAIDLEAKAKALNLEDPLQVITVASLVQAEGKTHDDFRKMAEVVYNRLKTTNTETNRYLQFDSTFNYLKGQSNIRISESEINSNKDPYNTYTQKGLPPGPIDNPGDEALAAALNPTHDGWIYFVATDGENKTEFAKTYAEFQALKEKFNDSSGN
ncbi:endolytic transglycosylase MltG [Streptomyces prunicolor]|uniref:Endolytic murein transglycosylase n=1 Tax=Streptomyces prunicolor TaxID=67348 RepID=A0ABU4FDZ7_9ACTN|nr:endolytic transglycosylase MltG [Streptomyces prunicolor]MCX5241606.1 endolytic transglycosylase MltG [Streptomyces prunicolor]MDV7218801.1 endolytic transglycosylase MltG [Streptomyces prunicolor]